MKAGQGSSVYDRRLVRSKQALYTLDTLPTFLLVVVLMPYNTYIMPIV